MGRNGELHNIGDGQGHTGDGASDKLEKLTKKLGYR